jgi:hypothetical protein
LILQSSSAAAVISVLRLVTIPVKTPTDVRR